MPSEFETVITDQTQYGTIITTQGAAMIAQCILEGKKLPIVEAAAGDADGAYYQPTVDQTALKGEKWRGQIVSATLNSNTPNMLDVKIVIGEDVGGFTIREMALFDADGNMIAICNTPATEKVMLSGNVSGKLTMLMHLLVADASVLEFTITPSLDTVTRQEMDAALEASLSNKADWKYVFLNEGTDLNDIVEMGAYVITGEVAPTIRNSIVPNPSYLFVFPADTSYNRVIQIQTRVNHEATNNGMTLWYRKHISSVMWSDWVAIATAEEPEWYEAVLMGDWTAVQQPRYCKDGGGTVHVTGAVACNTAPSANDNLIHIPAGFRPQYNVPVSLVQAGNPVWVSYGWLTTNGYLTLNSASQPAGFKPEAAVAFAASFPAASY